MKFSIRKLTWLALSVTFLFVLDRVLRWYAEYRLPVEGQFIVEGRIGLVLDQNPGLLYGIAVPRAWLVVALIIIVLGIVTALVVTAQRRQHKFMFPLTLMLVGTLSNLLDRVQHGYVIDMLTVSGEPIFNVADVMIVVGAAWILVQVFRARHA